MKWECTVCIKLGHDTKNPNPCEFVIKDHEEADYILPVFCPFDRDLEPNWSKVADGDKHISLWHIPD